MAVVGKQHSGRRRIVEGAIEDKHTEVINIILLLDQSCIFWHRCTISYHSEGISLLSWPITQIILFSEAHRYILPMVVLPYRLE